VPLPLADHLGGAGAGTVAIASHPEDDLLRERDPDLLVVNELVVVLEGLDRPGARCRVEVGVEPQTVALADAAVPLGPQLRPRPKEREVDIEENGLQHRAEDRSTAGP
jgi:hypothetical protein